MRKSYVEVNLVQVLSLGREQVIAWGAEAIAHFCQWVVL